MQPKIRKTKNFIYKTLKRPKLKTKADITKWLDCSMSLLNRAIKPHYNELVLVKPDKLLTPDQINKILELTGEPFEMIPKPVMKAK
jgi:hypothetical protein